MTPDQIKEAREIIERAICECDLVIHDTNCPIEEFVGTARTGWPAALDEIERLREFLQIIANPDNWKSLRIETRHSDDYIEYFDCREYESAEDLAQKALGGERARI